MRSPIRRPSWSARCRKRGDSSMTAPLDWHQRLRPAAAVSEPASRRLMYNCPEYLESSYAAFKLRATPVNVNYRYKAPEIAYICDNAGAEALVFHGSLGPQVAAAVTSMPTVRTLLQVDDGTPLVEGAEWYHDVVEGSEPAARIERSGEEQH